MKTRLYSEHRQRGEDSGMNIDYIQTYLKESHSKKEQENWPLYTTKKESEYQLFAKMRPASSLAFNVYFSLSVFDIDKWRRTQKYQIISKTIDEMYFCKKTPRMNGKSSFFFPLMS